MLSTCQRKTFIGERDRAILLKLLDTGASAQEFIDIDLNDVDIIKGEMLIRRGKGQKPRIVYLGKMSRITFRAYIKQRPDISEALRVSVHGERLTYEGLRSLIRRRASQAKVKVPPIHAFPRSFAISMIRAGGGYIQFAKADGTC